jgi:hypothetical protein
MFLAQHHIHIPQRLIIIQRKVCLCHIFYCSRFSASWPAFMQKETFKRRSRFNVNWKLNKNNSKRAQWVQLCRNVWCSTTSRHFPLSLNHFRRDGKILMQMKPQQKRVMSACRYNCNFSSFCVKIFISLNLRFVCVQTTLAIVYIKRSRSLCA